VPAVSQQHQPNKTSLRSSAATTSDPSASTATISKSVRFSDNPPVSTPSPDLEAQRANRTSLFGAPYRDDPDAPAGYRDAAEGGNLSNQQIHAYHEQILTDQDEQLDALGQSIGRQRELSMRIGDELDDQVAMLDESERVVDRHQSRLDRARKQVDRITKGAAENKQMTAIVILIIVLVLLIIILK
jgi:syntaxin 8